MLLIAVAALLLLVNTINNPPAKTEKQTGEKMRKGINPQEPENIRTKKEIENQSDSKIYNTDGTNAQVSGSQQAKMRNLLGLRRFEWVDPLALPADLVDSIRRKMRRAFPAAEPDSQKTITDESVLSHVGQSLSMAFPPVKGGKVGFLSGGRTSGPVDDFSSGIAVDAPRRGYILWG